MSPGVLTTEEPGFSVSSMDKPANKKLNFGAVMTGLDLQNISDAQVQALSDAIWIHKVVVVKNQNHVQPIKQWELVTRLDPEAEAVHGHGDLKTFNAKGGVLSRDRTVYAIPGAENVRVIGKGYQGSNHYGLVDTTIKAAPAHDYHALPLPDEEFEAGHTRFHRWHVDAALYGRDPPKFTTLRCLKRPTGTEVSIHWDDGSGRTMKSEPGLTAFFSNVQAYDLMSDKEKRMADHSWVEYAPHPYLWMGDCKSKPHGLGLESQNKEKSLDQLGAYDEKDVKRYPMVWVNPVTGEKSFMVHGICVRKMFLRSSADEEPTVVTDLAAIRAWLQQIQERVLSPEYILIPELAPGDIVMWANWQVFHSAVDYHPKLGPRTMHQANVGASTSPTGPVPIPAMAW
ncbi:hypothetical protein MAPG_07266 [Magnaporthiopsis poae ATCC 64411]|uniref:TauD/TfdA-like domain-containing protein n=1 Tax=Magnaporthiopsis poae (strain ATCC 64411 / 73-15) TaxID=644358 RepID=A0A0C4E477_MAGP6|nr:hypothetical protein MAPG_07266 [Magnaporthiopsis poae ATCC 64411]